MVLEDRGCSEAHGELMLEAAAKSVEATGCYKSNITYIIIQYYNLDEHLSTQRQYIDIPRK